VPVGGAAHAMTPTSAKAPARALEDAVVLAKVLDGGDLDAYDRLRRPRTQMIIAWAHRIGAAAPPSSPLAVRLRNMAVRCCPAHPPPAAWPGTGLDRVTTRRAAATAAPFCERQLN